MSGWVIFFRSKRLIILTAMVFLTTPILSGCFEDKAQQGAGIGALGGALAGSLLGRSKNREQNALIGAAVGGMLGYAVGNEMDKNDRAQLSHTLETAPSRKTTSWVNPDTRAEYAVTPQPAYQDNAGRDCRQAEIVSTINGKRETVVKTACRRPDGRWDI
ncbi:MAG: glycine zipper 2TM domain-containing protein [Magnetococcales bacterium]|nr:glycine zipper 2TM domain-containing protein [Magnetococcales bacterium]